MTFLQTIWPDERIEKLKAFRAAGGSASEIAAKLSTIEGIKITRNAVCGKIDRLGLGVCKKVRTEAEIQEAHKRRRQMQNEARHRRRSSLAFMSDFIRSPRAEKQKMIDATPLPPLNLMITDLTMKDGRPAECRFITNEELADARYCGHAVDGESSWCLHHRLRFQVPASRTGSAYVPKIVRAA